MKIKMFEEFSTELFTKKDVICDMDCLSKVKEKYPDAVGFEQNSALISRLKSSISIGKKDILVVLNNNAKEDRISFIKEFVGKGSYEIKKVSEI